MIKNCYDRYDRNHDLINSYRSICVTNDYGFVPFVLITIQSFPSIITDRRAYFVTRYDEAPEFMTGY